MIGITKLLTGRAGQSDRYRYADRGHRFVDEDGYHPVVVWNVTEACNLECAHCYYSAMFGRDEATIDTDRARAVIDSLARARVPVLLFSGGEPLMRRDLLELAAHASSLGIDPVLSTNGTRIQSVEDAQALADHGFRYVGISVDGRREHHDLQRRRPGSFERAVRAIGYCRAADLRVSIRFTITAANQHDLPQMLDLAQACDVDRFCMYHLVPSGRGKRHGDIDDAARRAAVELLCEQAEHRPFDILTVDSPADGPLVHQWALRHRPQRAAAILEVLARHGGDGTGRRIVEIDHEGTLHPNQFWLTEPLGNVLEVPFEKLWNATDAADLAPLLVDLRSETWPLQGACGSCSYAPMCGGLRARAANVTGSLWGSDPACVLHPAERVHPGESAVATPMGARR